MAPMVRGRKGAHQDIFAKMNQAGLLRARVDGEIIEIENAPSLEVRKNHSIDAICDRLIIRDDVHERLVSAVRMALGLADGVLTASYALPNETTSELASTSWQDKVYSTKYACASCGISIAEIEPRNFSFNSPYGACPECNGLGCIPPPATPKRTTKKTTTAEVTGDGELQYDRIEPCGSCSGQRLRPESLAVRLGGRSIAEITRLSLQDARDSLKQLEFSENESQIAKPILAEMMHRIEFLCQVGVSYLTLDRPADTLSGGELQRVRLATCLGSGLVGACYILDEPSIGLHPCDSDRLIDAMVELRDQGNTVVVVEHDESMIRAADFVIDMGPGAGPNGGTILAQGTPTEVAQNSASITGAYLSGHKSIPVPAKRRVREESADRMIRIRGARLHNLKSIDVDFPLGLLVGVTGVSGSGKSSLVNDTLAHAIRQGLAKPEEPVSGPFDSLIGVEHIDKLILIDQQSLGRNSRSTPSTYTGVWDEIRQVYAQTRDAKQRGFAANRFSFNAGDGRCEQCQGQGQQKIEMQFLADVYVPCSHCGGRRFNRPTLAVRYKEKNVADILSMSIAEAADFFQNFSKIARILDALVSVGLGYLSLGQPSHTLSGGEAQRIKLATELSRVSTSKTLYILDEPTTGLHMDDIGRLLHVLQSLVDQGNTVIVIEHHPDVMKVCDWLIDMGPTGGAAGGYCVASGPPELIANNKASLTGNYLMKALV
jgi:excinuclease ABC subunit A